MTTPQRVRSILERLPELACEVFLTWGHPNPSGETNTESRRAPAGSKPPTDLAAWDALRPDEKGMLAQVSMCVRLVAEELRDAGEQWPDLGNPPTWAGECRWLLDTAHWWQAQPWHDDIDHDILAVYAELAQASRQPRPLRLVCPRAGCGWPVHPKAEGSYYQCEADHIIDHHAEVKRMGQVQEMTEREIAQHLKIPGRTLRRWAGLGWVKPSGKRGREHVYVAADVRAVAESVFSRVV